ncbi:MAG: hypothetical protein J6X85_06960 [Ruminococcus sp.]|nr:hypothetical protein [Ruminococcus sp.]
MANYTYEDFEKAARKANMYDQFSAADLNLAKNNADAGMSLLSYKQDYAGAQTDADREAANRGAEALRAAYGGYTGGVDGSKYYLNDTMTATNPNTPMTWTNFVNFTGGQAPQRNKEYEDLYRDYLNQIINREKFSYDAESDPVYQQYKNQYTREGNRAMQDTLGQVSARTGGLASSYAGTAAAQANNYYMQQLADKIPELYNDAYNRYLKEFQMQMDTLGAVGNGRDYDLNAYGVDRNVYDTDRQFAYNQYGDAYNAKMQEDQLAYDRERQARQDKLDEEALQRELADWYAQHGNYSRAIALDIDPSVYQKSSGGGGGYYGGGSKKSNVFSEDYDAIANQANVYARQGAYNLATSYLKDAVKEGLITEDEYYLISKAVQEERQSH